MSLQSQPHLNYKCSLQYERCWREWNAFCETHHLAPLEANPEQLLAYLVHVAHSHSSSVSTAYTHMSAVAYHYRIAGRHSITENVTVQLYMKGLKRRNLSQPVKRANPMTVEILDALRKLVGADRHPSLVTWRTVWRAHAEFGLLLRFDDIKRYTN